MSFDYDEHDFEPEEPEFDLDDGDEAAAGYDPLEDDAELGIELNTDVELELAPVLTEPPAAELEFDTEDRSSDEVNASIREAEEADAEEAAAEAAEEAERAEAEAEVVAEPVPELDPIAEEAPEAELVVEVEVASAAPVADEAPAATVLVPPMTPEQFEMMMAVMTSNAAAQAAAAGAGGSNMAISAVSGTAIRGDARLDRTQQGGPDESPDSIRKRVDDMFRRKVGSEPTEPSARRLPLEDAAQAMANPRVAPTLGKAGHRDGSFVTPAVAEASGEPVDEVPNAEVEEAVSDETVVVPEEAPAAEPAMSLDTVDAAGNLVLSPERLSKMLAEAAEAAVAKVVASGAAEAQTPASVQVPAEEQAPEAVDAPVSAADTAPDLKAAARAEKRSVVHHDNALPSAKPGFDEHVASPETATVMRGEGFDPLQYASPTAETVSLDDLTNEVRERRAARLSVDEDGNPIERVSLIDADEAKIGRFPRELMVRLRNKLARILGVEPGTGFTSDARGRAGLGNATLLAGFVCAMLGDEFELDEQTEIVANAFARTDPRLDQMDRKLSFAMSMVDALGQRMGRIDENTQATRSMAHATELSAAFLAADRAVGLMSLTRDKTVSTFDVSDPLVIEARENIRKRSNAVEATTRGKGARTARPR